MLQVWWELFDGDVSNLLGVITIAEIAALNYDLQEAAEFHVIVGGTEIASGYSPPMTTHDIGVMGNNAVAMAAQEGLEYGQVVIRGSKLALAQLLPRFLALAN